MTDKPNKPAELAKDRRAQPPVRRWAIVLHWAGVAALLTAPVLETPWVRWLATGALLVQALGNLSIRSLFRRHARTLPSLTHSIPSSGRQGRLPGISAIVPARNEAPGLESALRSLLGQEYPGLEVIALNDGSTDETPEILDRLAGEFSTLRVIHNPLLQNGWHGKANAVWHGVHAANPENEWLLLTDADAVFEPDALQRAVVLAHDRQWDFLTAIVFLDNGSFWEELILPAAWAGLAINARPGHLDDASSVAIGVGPFILVRRTAYLESGGHSRIRGRQPEDTLLAGIVKQWGGKMGVVMADGMVRVRIYRGYGAIRDALIRKSRIHSGGHTAFLELRLAYILLQEVLPFPLLLLGVVAIVALPSLDASWATFTAAALAAYLSWVLTVRAFRRIASIRPLLEWLHPLAGCLRFWFTLRAWWESRTGRPMYWRGRPYSLPEQQDYIER